MAKRKSSPVEPTSKQEIAKLKARINELELQNKELANKLNAKTKKPKKPIIKNIFTTLFLIIGVLSLTLANVAGWVRYTIIDNQGFVEATQPIIEQPAVQQALQDDISGAIFDNIDLEQRLKTSLPPDIAFLAAPLASQVESFGTEKIGELIRSQQVADIWSITLQNLHEQLVAYILNEDNDGVVSVEDVYTFVGAQLTDSQIGFLLNKQLPDKVANITIAEVNGVEQARQTLNIIQDLPVILFLISLLSFIFAVVLSSNKIKTISISLILLTIMMLVTLMGIVVAKNLISSEVPTAYASASTEIYQVVTTNLVARTQGYLALFVSILLVILFSAKYKYVVLAKLYIAKIITYILQKLNLSINLPDWVTYLTKNRHVIAWTIFIVIFLIFGFRLPPEAGQVIFGFIGASVTSLIYLIVTKSLILAQDSYNSSVK